MTDAQLKPCPFCGGDRCPKSRGSVAENLGFLARASYIRTDFVELSALTFTPSDKDKELERLREALIEIERTYYNEGEDVKRRAARMRALANAALEDTQ